MRVNRRFLYTGLFLLAIGAIVVAADAGALDTATLTDVVRLWPLAPLVVGLAIVLRRTQFSLSAGMLAAAVPGLMLGSAFAVVPRFAGDCGVRGTSTSVATEQGTFASPASVSITSGCGTLTIGTAPGNGWAFRAGNTAGRTPTVHTSPGSLTIASHEADDRNLLDAGRDSWELTLPTSEIEALTIETFANRSEIALPGAHIGRLRLTADASDIVLDLKGAAIGELSGAVNVGSLAIHLPTDAGLAGSVRIGGGELVICSSPDVGLRVTTRGTPRLVTADGVEQSGSEWRSPGYATAAHRADLDVHVNFGAIKINPIGGCR